MNFVRDLRPELRVSERSAVHSRAGRLTLFTVLVAALFAGCLGLLRVASSLVGSWEFALLAVACAIPALLFSSEIALSLGGLLVPKHAWLMPGQTAGQRPRLSRSFRSRTPIAIPLLVRSALDVKSALLAVEENWIMGGEADVQIVLLVDFADAQTEHVESDSVLRAELERGLHELNGSRSAAGLLPAVALYRHRQWNPHEKRWMGWERKRGKIVEFGRLVRSVTTSFTDPCPSSCLGVERIFVMDVDTRVRASDVLQLEQLFLSERASAPAERRPAILAPFIAALDLPEELVERYLCDPTVLRGREGWREPRLRQAVLGSDIYHGKALLDVDDFLALSSLIDENTILSHDHLEAILGHGCSTDAVSVYEPFPSSRLNWERRQHRWIRGDLQVVRWSTRASGLAQTRTSRLLQRIGFFHIVLNVLNPVFLYLAAILAMEFSATSAALIILFLVVSPRDHVLPNFFKALAIGIKSDRIRLRRSFAYLLSNGALRSVGTIVFLQRNAILAFDALVLVSVRIARGRARLLEWYPDDPDTVIVRRRVAEFWLLLLAAASYALHIVSAAIPLAVGAWIIIPWSLAKLSKIKRDAPSSPPAS